MEGFGFRPFSEVLPFVFDDNSVLLKSLAQSVHSSVNSGYVHMKPIRLLQDIMDFSHGKQLLQMQWLSQVLPKNQEVASSSFCGHLVPSVFFLHLGCVARLLYSALYFDVDNNVSSAEVFDNIISALSRGWKSHGSSTSVSWGPLFWSVHIVYFFAIRYFPWFCSTPF